jgi:hypothetical protein
MGWRFLKSKLKINHHLCTVTFIPTFTLTCRKEGGWKMKQFICESIEVNYNITFEEVSKIKIIYL